jgi:hypothetical protein
LKGAVEMDTRQRNNLMLRWSFISAGSIALCWLIWYWVHGSVPVVSEIVLSQDATWELPIGISRWWDVLIGPIWTILIVWIVARVQSKEQAYPDLGFGLVFGLVFGLGYGLVVGLVFGLGKLVNAKLNWKRIGNWLAGH